MDNYFKLLPDIKNIFISIIPTISYFISVKFYSRYQFLSPKIVKKEHEDNSSKSMKALSITNILATYPLFNYFELGDGVISFYNVLLGMVIVDTLEYLFHYFYHSNTKIFLFFHKKHHQQVIIHPRTAFLNSQVALLDGIPIMLTLMFFNFKYIEYIIITSLSIISTVCEHTNTSNKKFHYIHHHIDKQKNLQQPFFTFWDHIFGTYYQETEIKIPFLP